MLFRYIDVWLEHSVLPDPGQSLYWSPFHFPGKENALVSQCLEPYLLIHFILFLLLPLSVYW